MIHQLEGFRVWQSIPGAAKSKRTAESLSHRDGTAVTRTDAAQRIQSRAQKPNGEWIPLAVCVRDTAASVQLRQCS
jgi:hypothetical protein